MSVRNTADVYTVRYDPSNGDWALLKRGASRAVRRAATKTDLMPEARNIASNNAPAILVEENTSGGTRNEWTYGNPYGL